MRLSSRLQVGQYWGINTPALSFALTGPAMLKEAIKQNNVVNVAAVRARPDDMPDKDSIAVHPLSLAWSRVYDVNANSKANWTDAVNNLEYFDELSKATPDGVPVLAHTAQATSSYVSNPTTYKILQNGGFCVRFQLQEIKREANEQLELDYFQIAWGITGVGSRWQFVICNDKPAIMRLAPTWTQGDEDNYHLLLMIKSPTAEQETQIETLRKQLYVDYKTVSLNKDYQGGRESDVYELTFLPEPLGKVSIYQGLTFVDEANDSSILSTRRAGILWGESAISIRRNEGHFAWQVGWPEFATTGTLTFPYRIGRYDALPQFNIIADAPAGTSVTPSNTEDAVATPVWAYLVLTLSTTNNRITPFLYAAHAHIPASLRTMDPTVWLDTDLMSTAPIKNSQPQFDGENRRAQFTVALRDINGTTFGSPDGDTKFHHDTTENRIANHWIGGAAVLTQGIVKAATAVDMAQSTDGAVRSTITHPWSGADLVLCDQWALLEEYELYEGELVGDGMAVGAFIKRGLRLAGIGHASEVANITDGPLLPSAAIGETWAVMCGSSTLADYLIQIVERYGMGRQLWIDGSGVWHFGYRSTAMATVGGFAAHFTSSAELIAGSTYPGRFSMLQPLDLITDTGEFYNVIPVIGATLGNRVTNPTASSGYTEEPIAGMWIDWKSIIPGAVTRPKNFIGRPRRMTPVIDNGLRTMADIDRVTRSLWLKYGRSFRYIGFDTFFHYGLFVGSRITCDGVPCEIIRVSGADIANDKMYIMAKVVG